MYAPGKGLCGVWGIANMLQAFFESEAASALSKCSQVLRKRDDSSTALFLVTRIVKKSSKDGEVVKHVGL